jgi:hypothetical protein
VSGNGTIKQKSVNDSLVLQFTTDGQTVVEVGSGVLLYILGARSPDLDRQRYAELY